MSGGDPRLLAPVPTPYKTRCGPSQSASAGVREPPPGGGEKVQSDHQHVLGRWPHVLFILGSWPEVSAALLGLRLLFDERFKL